MNLFWSLGRFAAQSESLSARLKTNYRVVDAAEPSDMSVLVRMWVKLQVTAWLSCEISSKTQKGEQKVIHSKCFVFTSLVQSGRFFSGFLFRPETKPRPHFSLFCPTVLWHKEQWDTSSFLALCSTLYKRTAQHWLISKENWSHCLTLTV